MGGQASTGAVLAAGQPSAGSADGLFEFVLLKPIEHRGRNHFAAGRHVFVNAHQRRVLRHLGVIGDEPYSPAPDAATDPAPPAAAASTPRPARRPRARKTAPGPAAPEAPVPTGADPEAPTGASAADDGSAPDLSCTCAGADVTDAPP